MTDLGVPFDDATGEDGWDASDRLILQFDNIVKRVRELLTELAAEPARAARLEQDLATIRSRILARDLD